MLLAIDTATTLTGLACYDEQGLQGEATWYSGRNHSAQVLPQLRLMLQHLQRRVVDLQAVAVALGPGSWSGLRVGMSLAKGMALAGNLPVLGVGTLDALAYQHQHPTLPIYPVIRLGRERFATARFVLVDSQLERQTADQNVSVADLSAHLHEAALFCGDLDATLCEQLYAATAGQAVFPAPAANLRRPGYLAALGWQRFVAGERDDLATLEPRYLGAPVQPKPKKSNSPPESQTDN